MPDLGESISRPLAHVLVMLTQITAIARVSSSGAPKRSSWRSGPTSLASSSQAAPAAHSHPRRLCTQSNKNNAESAYNSSGEFFSQIITQLDNNVTDKYWPGQPSAEPLSHENEQILRKSPHDEPSTGHVRSSSHYRGVREYPNERDNQSDFQRHSRNSNAHGSRNYENNGRERRSAGDRPIREDSNNKKNQTTTWSRVRATLGSTPSNHPRNTSSAQTHVKDSRLLLSKPHTSHLTDKSIYLRQSIVNAPNRETYVQECESFIVSPNFDPFVLHTSRLMFMEKNEAPDLNPRVHTQELVDLLAKDLEKLIQEKTEDEKRIVSYTGERIDLAISLVAVKDFACYEPLLEKIIAYLGIGGVFDPPALSSTWRRVWTHTAHAISTAGFAAGRYTHMAELCVALCNHIYLHPTRMVGHLRAGGAPPRTIIDFLPRNPSLPPRSPLLDIELNEVSLGPEAAPLLRGPQAVSAMIAILSQIGGHQALRRAYIHLYARMAEVANAFPSRRLMYISALLLSWQEFDAAMTGLHALQQSEASLLDLKSSQHELESLQYLMVSNCSKELLTFVEATLIIPGHIPSPLALSLVLWAAKETKEHDRALSWWHKATVIWRDLPNNPHALRGKSATKPLVRPSLDASTEFLTLIADEFSLEELEKVNQDYLEIFGVRPPGSRSRLITKQAKSGNLSKAISLLADPAPHTHGSSGDGPDSHMHLMTANLIITACNQNSFDKTIQELLQTSTAATSSIYLVGGLVDYVTALLPAVDLSEITPNDALPFLPFLNWVAALPMVAYDAQSASVVPAPLDPVFADSPHSQFMETLLARSREAHGKNTTETLAHQIAINARTAARLAELGGLCANPHLVTNILKRINAQHQAANRGQTVPFGWVWFRPLIRAHALSGNTDIVFQLLGSLKESLLPSERADAWKLAFKCYNRIRNPDAAIQLFLNVRNKTLDSEVPTWSGGYTMGIQMLMGQGDMNRAVQLYLLMIGDGFELRDRNTVGQLIEYLQRPAIENPTDSSDNGVSQLTPNQHETTLNRLLLLHPTLDDSRPSRALSSNQSARRRMIKAKKANEKAAIADLDRAMHTYKPRRHHSL